MTLPPEDALRFYRLHKGLMLYVNRRLALVEEPEDNGDELPAFPLEDRFEVRNALREHMDLIDAFAAENPFGFPEEDLEVIRSWKHLIAGQFTVFRYLKSHTIFLSMEEPMVAYGVLALGDPFEEVIGPYLPVLCETVLLPFEGRIVYDGLMRGYNVAFGAGYRRSFKETYDEAKARFGIVTTLPFDPEGTPKPSARSKAGSKKRGPKSGKSGGKPTAAEKARRAHDEIVERTDAFCREHLDAEYAALCQKLAGVLSRKRPSPLARGKPESWASGIVRVVGWVNFLGDPSQPHHMKMSDIDEMIGVSEATGSAKSMAIRDLLKIHRLDPEWALPSRMDDNPLVWMLEVDGLIVDARQMPREFQEAVYQQGLIPYIPSTHQKESVEE